MSINTEWSSQDPDSIGMGFYTNLNTLMSPDIIIQLTTGISQFNHIIWWYHRNCTLVYTTSSPASISSSPVSHALLWLLLLTSITWYIGCASLVTMTTIITLELLQCQTSTLYFSSLILPVTWHTNLITVYCTSCWLTHRVFHHVSMKHFVKCWSCISYILSAQIPSIVFNVVLTSLRDHFIVCVITLNCSWWVPW